MHFLFLSHGGAIKLYEGLPLFCLHIHQTLCLYVNFHALFTHLSSFRTDEVHFSNWN